MQIQMMCIFRVVLSLRDAHAMLLLLSIAAALRVTVQFRTWPGCGM